MLWEGAQSLHSPKGTPGAVSGQSELIITKPSQFIKEWISLGDETVFEYLSKTRYNKEDTKEGVRYEDEAKATYATFRNAEAEINKRTNHVVNRKGGGRYAQAGKRIREYQAPKEPERAEVVRKPPDFLSQVQAAVDHLKIPGIIVHKTEYSIPEEALGKGTIVEGNLEGVYHDGKIHLVAENLSPARIEPVILHEAAHKGLHNLLGDRLNPTLEQIARDYRKDLEEIAEV